MSLSHQLTASLSTLSDAWEPTKARAEFFPRPSGTTIADFPVPPQSLPSERTNERIKTLPTRAHLAYGTQIYRRLPLVNLEGLVRVAPSRRADHSIGLSGKSFILSALSSLGLATGHQLGRLIVAQSSTILNSRGSGGQRSCCFP